MKQILRSFGAALLVVWGNFGACAAVGHPTFLSPQASPIARVGGFVFVANTPADTVDVIQARRHRFPRGPFATFEARSGRNHRAR